MNQQELEQWLDNLNAVLDRTVGLMPEGTTADEYDPNADREQDWNERAA